ncbi:Alpha-L-fucosidase [compost metagenome]
MQKDQPWIAEAPVADWFYTPDFTYDSGMMIRYIIEAIARDGNAAICISLLPDGSINEESQKMLEEVGNWMRLNGEGVYGSHAWVIPAEGEMINGKLKMLPGGKLDSKQAEFKFNAQDIRFTVGKNNKLYAFCMNVPAPNTQIKIKSLGANAKHYGKKVKTVNLLGYKGKLKWKETADGLLINCPKNMPFVTAIVFEIE